MYNDKPSLETGDTETAAGDLRHSGFRPFIELSGRVIDSGSYRSQHLDVVGVDNTRLISSFDLVVYSYDATTPPAVASAFISATILRDGQFLLHLLRLLHQLVHLIAAAR